MESIIEKIFFGNRGTFDGIEMSEEYRECVKKELKLFEELDSLITEQQRELFEAYADAVNDSYAEATLCYYKEGFKVGLLIGMEVNE